MTAVIDARAVFRPDDSAIVGESEPIRRLRSLITAVARTRLPVLIQGPTGAGKELVAAALHASSGRRGAFVAFNVCAISESMFEDALFGHVRGAFTGAVTDAPGFLMEADGGTAFFDEVSGLTPPLQAKLLRAIETGVFRPVGAKRDAASDFRVVAATNERLDVLVARGAIRPDFAHRLGAVTIDVPALADRLEDLPLLVRHFLDRCSAGHVRVDDGTVALLERHSWPGNVRELRHVVEWAAAMGDGQLGADVVRAALAQRADALSGLALLARHIDVGAARRKLVRDALEQFNWNTELAARHLGVHRATLYRRMKRLGLSVRTTIL